MTPDEDLIFKQEKEERIVRSASSGQEGGTKQSFAASESSRGNVALERKVKKLELQMAELLRDRQDISARTYIEKDLHINGKIFVGSKSQISTPSIESGIGVPNHVAPDGSIFMRTDGGSTSSAYVNYGGSSWAAMT
jgi:hypothetical protein